mgnify:FL=1
MLTRSGVLFVDSWRSTDNMFVPFTRGWGEIDIIMVSVSVSAKKLVDDPKTGQIAVFRD